jgi:hypothetical protein
MKSSLQQLLRLQAVTEAIRKSLRDFEQSRSASAGSRTATTTCLSAGLTAKRISRTLTEMAWAKQSVRISDIRLSLAGQLREVLATPFRAMLFTLTSTTFSFRNFFFSCIVPVVPFAAAYGTLIRQLNRRSEEELLEIIRHIHVPGYEYRLVRAALQQELHIICPAQSAFDRKAA